ncbi:Uncharacterized protein GBIM_11610 [Gryllus bimaculatus]|nr:Uncharacterized protein GBIM_11610 [Gryllus bimaculatus]
MKSIDKNKQHKFKKLISEMACWKTDEDIARDMDILSGIQSSEEKIKSYSSWGRGQKLNVHSDINTFPEPQEKTDVEEFKWFTEEETLGKLPDSIGRGKRLEILKANLYRSKEMEVHEQLREVMGPGYSNAFIEESFKKRLGLKNDQKPACSDLSVDQFQDSGQTDNIDNIGNYQNECVDPKSADSEPNHVPKVIKSRRIQRRYRNALLESLERNPENTSVKNEQTEIGGSLATRTCLFGNKSSNIPPACYLPGKNLVSYSPQKTQVSFEYKESEFPTL